ncbi:unnamed protein product [Clavelina lepadiformis]|uniref:Uncharacterized protein n=1 Tax=Clavelina lepadiformis TaxID=159417 RepID=A0ABP0F1U9_CLALP
MEKTSLSSSKNRNSQHDETLLVRKVANSASSLLMTSQSSNNRAGRLRRERERQMRSRENERSMHVFIRLMRAGRIIDDNLNLEETRPQAPPTTPVPTLSGGQNISDHDVTITESLSKSTTPRQKNRRNGNTNRSPSMLVNNWIGNDEANHNSWLVMRGRNIRLQHQDHVRNALNGTRVVQSATPVTVAHNNAATVSPRLKINGRYYNTGLGSGQSRSCTTTPVQSSSCQQSFRYSKGTFSASSKIRFHEPKSSERIDSSFRSGRVTAPPDLSKTLVIRIPQSTKISP